MVAHRRNVPTRKAYVPSGWFIVLTVMLCAGAAGWLGLLLIGDDDDPSGAPTAAAPSISVSPEPSRSTPKPSPSPATTEPSDEPVAERTAAVSVLNNSGIAGAARAFSARVTQAGWSLGGIGNWTGSIPANTVYYPADLRSQAELLGDDVGIARVRPSVAPMRMDRLTIILSGPQ